MHTKPTFESDDDWLCWLTERMYEFVYKNTKVHGTTCFDMFQKLIVQTPFEYSKDQWILIYNYLFTSGGAILRIYDEWANKGRNVYVILA